MYDVVATEGTCALFSVHMLSEVNVYTSMTI